MTTIPPLRPGMVPPFHELGPDVFEDLCRELVQAWTKIGYNLIRRIGYEVATDSVGA